MLFIKVAGIGQSENLIFPLFLFFSTLEIGADYNLAFLFALMRLSQSQGQDENTAHRGIPQIQ